jgi:hypothetical protein
VRYLPVAYSNLFFLSNREQHDAMPAPQNQKDPWSMAMREDEDHPMSCGSSLAGFRANLYR